MDQDKVIDTLNGLIENCKDGEYGFQSTAEHVRTPNLKQVFLSRADDCHMAAQQLQNFVTRLGGKSAVSGTLAGAAHRGWVAVKGTLAGYSDLRMLEEAERGEDASVARYREALDENLPPDVHSLVQMQYEGAQRNHLQIRKLRDQARQAQQA